MIKFVILMTLTPFLVLHILAI